MSFNRFPPSTIKSTPFLLLILLVSILTAPVYAEVKSQDLESSVKKIIMMMDIVVKEYYEGIQNGKIINDGEYEESQIFLKESYNRYQSISKQSPKPGQADSTLPLFTKLIADLKSKVDPGEVKSQTQKIQNDILNEFGIKMDVNPLEPVSLDQGKLIYESNCKICHGLSGKGDGPLAFQLNPKPAVLADPALTGDAETKAYDNFQIISVGIGGTAMVGWADTLSTTDIWNVTYYIRSFSNSNLKLPVVSAIAGKPTDGDSGGSSFKGVFQETRNLLEQSLATFKEGQIDSAAEQAFDAYLAYETIERGLANKNKQLGLLLESSFGRYRAEIKRKASLEQIESIYSGILGNLEEAEAVLIQKQGFMTMFFQSLAIIVREGFEAILIIAALITFLVKSRNEDKLKSIYSGVAVGILASFLTAYILHEILDISTASQELLEGWIMMVAVVVLFWVSYWLVTKIEAQKWQAYITGKMREAMTTGSAFTLATVAFLSVYREGFETVLFYKALYTYAEGSSAGIIPGFLVGCAVLAGVYYMINRLGVHIPVKWFFAVTSVLLYYMAFTFMGKGLHELQMGSLVSMTPAEFVPEIAWMGMYPTWETFIGQMILVAAYVFALIYTFGVKPEIESKQLQKETSHIRKDISAVHDLVEHISDHAKRCEIFLKDTADEDLKELSDHLREIHDKVHQLSNQVRYMEDHLQDEYDRLAGDLPAGPRELP